MPWYSVNASVVGSKHLGVFEAATPEEAEAKALEKAGHISVCHQCSSEVEDPEINEVFVEECEPPKKGRR